MTEQDYIDISSEIESLKASKALTSSFEEEMEIAGVNPSYNYGR